VDTSNSLTGLCGTKTYTLTNNSGGASVSAWVSVVDSTTTAGAKTLKVNSALYPTDFTTSSVAITVDVLVKLADYSGVGGTTSAIVVTINKAACSCAAMVWTAPTIQVASVALSSTLTVGTT